MVESMTDPVVYGVSQFREDYRVTYAKAFNELIGDRPKRSSSFIQGIEKNSIWQSELTRVKELLGYESKIASAKKPQDSRHLTWLTKIDGTSKGKEGYMSVAEDYSKREFSPNFHFLKISVRQRAPANIIRER